MKSPHLRLTIVVLFLGLIIGSAGQAQAQRRRAPGKNERHHPSVLSAFREVIVEARKSTVTLSVDDKQVALGVIVSGNGYILSKASELKANPIAKLSTGAEYPAERIGYHRDTDLVLLKIEAENLPVIKWREGDFPNDGSWLASPGAAEDPIAIGVVGVAPRKIDAPSGILGILLDQDDRGARIDQVMPGSGAEKAGLLVNDIVTMVNDTKVKTRDELIRFVRQFQPGELLRLKVIRGEKQLSVVATLGNRSNFDESDKRRDFQNSLGGNLSQRRTGFPAVAEHDSVLRPRECGGPVCDLDGHAIGVNIARAGRVSSLALPASSILPLIRDLASADQTPDTSIWQPIPTTPPSEESVEEPADDVSSLDPGDNSLPEGNSSNRLDKSRPKLKPTPGNPNNKQ